MHKPHLLYRLLDIRRKVRDIEDIENCVLGLSESLPVNTKRGGIAFGNADNNETNNVVWHYSCSHRQ